MGENTGMTTTDSPIDPWTSFASTVASLCATLDRISDSLVEQTRRYELQAEEIREAILEQDTRTARRVDALHTRIDEASDTVEMVREASNVQAGRIADAFARIDEMEGKR